MVGKSVHEFRNVFNRDDAFARWDTLHQRLHEGRLTASRFAGNDHVFAKLNAALKKLCSPFVGLRHVVNVLVALKQFSIRRIQTIGGLNAIEKAVRDVRVERANVKRGLSDRETYGIRPASRRHDELRALTARQHGRENGHRALKEDVFTSEFCDGHAEFDEVLVGELRYVLRFPTSTGFEVHLPRSVDDDFGNGLVAQKRTQRLQEVID